MAISKRTRYEVLRRDNNTCRYCHATDTPLTIDHVVPTALGGSDDPSNLVAACKDCNAGKTSSNPDAALVAQVSDDAVRWARAVAKAQEIAADDEGRARRFADIFECQWHLHAPEFVRRHPWRDVPSDWRQVMAGLARRPEVSDQLLVDAIAIAWAARNPEQRFYYFLGVINKKVEAVHEAARRLIAEGAV